jgi:hypothetical protein
MRIYSTLPSDHAPVSPWMHALWDSGGEGPDIPLMFLILRTRHDRDTVSRTRVQVQVHPGV